MRTSCCSRCRLVLELGHPLEVAVGGDRREQPAELRVLGHVGLAEQDAAVGIEAGGHQHRRRVEHVAGQRVRVVGHARGVKVDDAVDRGVAALLALEVAADGADVVAEVLAAGRLDAAEDAHGAGSLGRHLHGDPLHRVVRVALQVPGRVERLGVAGGVGRARAEHVLARLARPTRSANRARRARRGRARGRPGRSSRRRRSTPRRARSARGPTRRGRSE